MCHPLIDHALNSQRVSLTWWSLGSYLPSQDVVKIPPVTMKAAYLHQRKPVCAQMFCFLHGIGKKRFKNLVKSVKTNGLASHTHGAKWLASAWKSARIQPH